MMPGGTIRKTPLPRIDWEQVRTRLLTSERALESALSESPARIEATFQQRAAQIAKGRSRPSFAVEESAALVFWLAHERYAIELKELAEVLPYAQCAAVPGVDSVIRDVINIRGELRAVADLGRLLLGSADGGNASGFVLMLRRPGHEIGLSVDRIEGLFEVRADQLIPSTQSRYAKGIRGETLMLLDLDQVLAEVFAEGKTP